MYCVYHVQVDCEHAVVTLARSDSLLSMRHGLVRLDNVWGVGGGTRPVKYLVKQMVLLLEEFLSSSDIAEATRCLQELEVPHFHHEVVSHYFEDYVRYSLRNGVWQKFLWVSFNLNF